jgi:hypothetical protein
VHRIRPGLLALAAIALTAQGSNAQPGGVHARAVAALPLARQALQENLTDYRTARFRGVHARIVRSVYATDDGHPNTVPHQARGNPVLVWCGELDDHDGYGHDTGWRRFYVEPAQVDMQPMGTLDHPRRLTPQNVAIHSLLVIARYPSGIADVRVECGPGPGVQIDPADMSADLAAPRAPGAH